MQVDKLILSGFRCHERLEVQMAPVLLVTGENGTGKSSIQAALEWAFSGRCIYTDEKGSNGQLGRDGGNGYVCVAFVDPDTDQESGRATRQTDGGLTLSWKPGAKGGDAQSAFEADMRCSGDQARLALRAGRFFGMSAKDQKSLLYEMLNLTITASQVKLALTELGEPRSLPLLATAIRLLGGHEGELCDLGRAYKQCYEERTTQNRLAKNAKTKVGDLKKEGQALIFPTEDARLKLKQAMIANQQETEAAAKAEGARENLIAQRNLLIKARDTLAESARIAAQGLGDTPPDTEALWKRKPSVVARLDEVKKLLAESTSNRNATVKTRANLEAELRLQNAKRGQGGGCQFDNAHPCPGAATRQASVEAEVARITAQIAQLPTVEELDKQLAEIRERVAKGQGILDGIEDQLRLAVRWEKLAAAKQNLANAEEALSACPSPPVESAAGTLSLLKHKREQLLAEQEQHRTWDAHQKRVNEAKSSLEEAEYAASVLNELVPFFAADGYQARVLRECMEPLQASLASILSRWDLAARYSADLALQVRTREETWVDFARLSDGEQVLVALAHQVAFARLTGLQIVVVDRIEALDDARQTILLRACTELASLHDGPDHIILLGVRCVSPPEGVRHLDLTPALVGAA